MNMKLIIKGQHGTPADFNIFIKIFADFFPFSANPPPSCIMN